MVFTRRWLLVDDGDSATLLEEKQLESYESLRLALFRGPRSSLLLTMTMKATIKAWELTTKLASWIFAFYSPCG